MTPEQYKTWEELELVIYTDATTILDKLIELKKKHNIPLKGIDTLSFHELNTLFIVYTGIEQQVLFLTAQAIFNPEKFIEGEEKKILLNQHLDKFADSLSEVKKHNALAKLTAEEKQLLGLL